jgi:hypothetical protein
MSNARVSHEVQRNIEQGVAARHQVPLTKFFVNNGLGDIALYNS